jgi:hypothetical protein
MKVLLVIAALTANLCLAADLRPSLEDGYRAMYNLEFDEAHRVFQQWETANPADPLGPASDAAAYLFSEFDRLHVLQSEFFAQDEDFLKIHKLAPDPRAKAGFDKALDASRKLEASGGENTLFASVLTHGLDSDYLALIEKRYVAALGETKLARENAEKLIAAQPANYDAYMAVGVENYLLSLKPAPMRWLLHIGGAETDKQTGIDKLRITAEKGNLLLPFARLLLAVAAIRDKDHATARSHLTWLTQQFPSNRLFREELAKVQ